ncbi:hypothetical protein I79_021770 [Cricetulus griseus]|uniref:Uncharacterized protein n=1 Tax=Cricetulus griseus TaxID=10029 RepID=G3IDI8_CRIGR|nr:hypothetical protein I79_021770 [Cricetulus griseus]
MSAIGQGGGKTISVISIVVYIKACGYYHGQDQTGVTWTPGTHLRHSSVFLTTQYYVTAMLLGCKASHQSITDTQQFTLQCQADLRNDF